MKYLLVDVCIHKHITCYYYASCINTIQLKLNEQFKHKLIVVSNAKSIIIHDIKLQHILCSCISNLTNLISSIYQISCRKCILNKLENYISINYTIMTRWFFLSLSSLFLFSFLSSSSLSSMPRGGWRRPRAFT